MYKALYRKYRPQTFDDVYGQDTIVKTLKNSIKNKSYSHAYMFFGPRGTGKTSISKIFARSINCLDSKDGNSCGECKNCVNSYQKECVDIIEIDAASNNGVDEIRELRNKVSLVPAELKYKVYIIDEVHMLSIGAFNALLKTLEEPPEHVIFILATTDPQKVPETIISRCQCFSFKRISTESIITNLNKICQEENIDIDEDVLTEIAFSCDGGMRDALSSLDQLRSFCTGKITLDDYADVNGSLSNKEMQCFYENIFNSKYSQILNSINAYNDKGKNIILILEKLMRFMRDKIVKYYIENEIPEFDIKYIHKLILIINEKMFEIKRSANPIVYIEMIFLEFMNNLNVDFKQNNLVDSDSDKVNSFKIDQEKSEKIVKNVDIIKKNNNFLSEENSVQNSENDINNLAEMKKNNFEEEKAEISSSCIENINEIMKVRVNNTLANANKQILLKELSTFDLFNDFTFDQEIGYIACAILDSKIRAASDSSVIISYEYESAVKQNLENINKITEVYNMVTNSNKKIAIISDKEWEEVKSQYIKDLKNGLTLSFKEEPEEIFIKKENNVIINNDAIKLFGDIVEVN